MSNKSYQFCIAVVVSAAAAVVDDDVVADGGSNPILRVHKTRTRRFGKVKGTRLRSRNELCN